MRMKYFLLAATACCMYFSSSAWPQAPDKLVPLPTRLQQQLAQFQHLDQLVNWIYSQIQWVAQAPASRASTLTRAVTNAWRLPRSNEEKIAWMDLLTNEGYALLISGDIVHSTDAYTAAFDWAKDHEDIVDPSLVLDNILKPLGNNYTRLGDDEQALFIHKKALSIAVALNDRQALAGVCSNLANTCSNMGRPRQSLLYCHQGLQAVDPHSAFAGLLLSEQADALEQTDSIGAAQKSIGSSIAILEKAAAGRFSTEAAWWLLTAYQQAGDLYAAQPATSGKALIYYRNALTLQNRLQHRYGTIHRRELSKLYQRMAALYARMGDAARATTWLDRCSSVLVPGKKIDSLQLSDLYAENTLMDMLFLRADIQRRLRHPDEALRCYALAFATEEKLRYELISGASKEQSVADSRLRYEEAIKTAWDAWESTRNKKYQFAVLALMESSKSQLLLEELLQQQQDFAGKNSGDSLTNRIRLLERAQAWYRKQALEPPAIGSPANGSSANDSLVSANAAKDQELSWDLASLRKKTGAHGSPGLSAEPAAPAILLALSCPGLSTTSNPNLSPATDSLFSFLQPGQAVRSFFAGEKALYTAECTSAGISFIEKSDLSAQWQDSVRLFIHTFFQQGPDHMINHPSDYYRDAYTIYRQLTGLHPLKPGTEYILLPDGALSLLPVEALPTEPGYSPSPADWPFVLRQVLLSYGWSLATLKHQSGSAGQGNTVSGFFVSHNRSGPVASPVLTALHTEQAGIRHILPAGNWYTDEQATAGTFRTALQASAIVHISSHAYTHKDSLDAPHIQLFDAPFYLFELKGLERHPALVVLSACRTGDGRMVTGEGTLSMARAFVADGTNAVIAGWWNVNDDVTAQLMQRFYSNLVSAKSVSPSAVSTNTASPNVTSVNAALALRNARLDWLKDPDISYLYKLPYYWDALNYLGNPSPLPPDFYRQNKVPPIGRRHPSPWWWLLLVLLPGLLLLIFRHAKPRDSNVK
jgi:tetratricopeptide (TPR) repeat protein